MDYDERDGRLSESASPPPSVLSRVSRRERVGNRPRGLLANAQFADHGPVPLRIVRLQIVQQAAALAHQHQQSTPRSVILRVCLEMLSQVANALAQYRNLHLRAPGVGIMGAIACDYFRFLLRCQHVCAYSSSIFCDYTS